MASTDTHFSSKLIYFNDVYLLNLPSIYLIHRQSV